MRAMRIAIQGRRVQTPAKVLGASLEFWALPEAPRLSLSGSAIDSITCAGGTGRVWSKVSDARRPTRGTGGADGRPYISTVRASNTTLSTTAGTLTGSAPHSIWAVASSSEITGFASLVGVGRENGVNSVVGRNGGQWWGGGSGIGSPVGGSVDGQLHVLQKIYTAAGGLYLFVDGRYVSANGQARTLLAGSGIFPWSGGDMCTASLYQAVIAGGVWASGAGGLPVNTDAAAAKRKIDAYFASRHPSLKRLSHVVCLGDSNTNGDGVSDKVNDSYPGQLQASLGASYLVRRLGYSGNTSTQIEALWHTNVDHLITPLDVATKVVINAGTNDWFTGAGNVDTLLAKLQSLITKARTAGASRIVVCTIPVGNGVSNTYPTGWAASNTAIRALAGGDVAIADIAAAPGLTDFNDPTNFAGDKIHFTRSGYGIWASTIGAVL